MVTAGEQKLIQSYYTRVCISRSMMGAIGILLLEFIALVMVDDLVLTAHRLYVPGTVAMLALVAGALIYCCYGMVSLRTGLQKEPWRALVDRARGTVPDLAEQQMGIARGRATAAMGNMMRGSADPALDNLGDAAVLAGSVDSIRWASSMLAAFERHIAAVAGRLGVPLPNAKARGRAAVLAVAAVLALSFVPGYVGRIAGIRQERAQAAGPVHDLERTFAGACSWTTANDPEESYDDDGYLVTGHLGDYDSPLDPTVTATVDPDGVVRDVTYTLDVDVTLPLEESLARAEEDLAALAPLIAESGVAVSADELASFDALPEEFRQAYLAGSPYEEIFMSVLDESDGDPCDLIVAFYTDSEEDFGEYSSAYIHVSLEAE